MDLTASPERERERERGRENKDKINERKLRTGVPGPFTKFTPVVVGNG